MTKIRKQVKSRRTISSKVMIVVVAYIFTLGLLLLSFFVTPKQVDILPSVRLVIIFFASVLLSKYFFYMLFSPLETIRVALNKAIWQAKVPEYNPKVSVIIPAWNEEVGILTTLDSLLKSTYDNLEIVVVNDGSSDNSDAMIKSYMARYRTRAKKQGLTKKLVYRYQKNAGKGVALNKAIKLATGDIIISIDADCVVDKHAVAAFVERFRDPKVMAAVGNVKIGNVKGILGTIQYLEFLFSFYFKKADSLLNTIYIIGGAAGAFRREVFEKLGGYNTKNITEDIELSMRIQDAGWRIVYASDAQVYTEGASTLSGLKKQRLRWKVGRFQTFRDYRHMFLSGKKKHNKLLSYLILPLAAFAELQLMLEIPFILFLFVYSFIASDFTSFISGIIVVSSMFFFLMVFEDKSTRKVSFLALAPIAWLLFYSMTYVEAVALKNSILSQLKGEKVGWQKWERKGINGV